MTVQDIAATCTACFVRYQSAMPHPQRDGVYLGIFAAVNVLSQRQRLNAAQEAFRRETNRWFNENLSLPTDTDPDLYAADRPQAVAWFKRSASAHLARIPGYLRILDDLGIGWYELEQDDPGTILYEDAFQVVATPCPPLPLPVPASCPDCPGNVP